MPINWDDFTPVEDGAHRDAATVDWSQFAPVGMIDTPAQLAQRALLASAPGATGPADHDKELLTAVANDPLGALKAIPGAAMQVLALPGRLAYAGAADVVAGLQNLDAQYNLTGNPPRAEYGGNLRQILTQPPGDPLPVERFIGSVAETNPKSAVAANVAKALPELAGMMVVNPAGGAGRLLAGGFSADMILHAQPLFEEYAAEINLPPEQQNAGKIAELEAGILQTFAFAPLAGKHAAGRPVTPGETAGRMLGREVKRADVAAVYDRRAGADTAPLQRAGEPAKPPTDFVPVNWEDFRPVTEERGTAAETPTNTPSPEPQVGEQSPLPPEPGRVARAASDVASQREATYPEPPYIPKGVRPPISSPPGEATPPAGAEAMAGRPTENVPPARAPSKAAPERTTPPAEQSGGVKQTARPGDAIEATKAEQPSQPGGAPAIQPPVATPGKRIARGLSGVSRFNRETELGGPDILEFIREFGGMVSKSEARRSRGAEWWSRNQSLYDDATPLAQPHHNVIYTKGRNYPDQVAQAAFEARVLPEPSVPALWAAVRRSSNRRANVFAQAKEQVAEIGRLEKEHTDWLKATAEGEQRINADDLKVGDLLEVEGERVRVREIDPDTGDVILDDGKKFGTQRLPGGQAIHVEKFETTDAPVEFAPPEPAAVPKLRAGEKGTGDLLQGQDAPFNLMGEKGIDMERVAREKAQALATAKANEEFQARSTKDLFGGGSGMAASKSPGVTDFPVLLGGLDAIRPLETPELLRLTREFAGSEVTVRKLRGYLRGFMQGRDITLSKDIFADPRQVAMTLAHEIGHVNDFLPEGTLKRGNLVGRLVGEVHQFLKGSFGGLNNAELRTELKALSAYWRPWDEAVASKSEKAYRNSAKELYADAISVLLNSPGLLEQRAPKFYKAFFEHLDKKPKFKEEFFALQDLLARGPEAVLGERLKQSREGFEKGAAILHEKIAFRQAARNSFKDFLTKVRIQSSDIASFVRRKLGSKDPRQPSEFDRLYEEWKFDDNRNAADVSRIYHEMIQPVVKTGLDEHAFGQVLELQRIMGGVDAYRDMQAMRQALGPEKMNVLKKASEDMASLERQGLADELGGGPLGDLDRAGIPGELLDTYRQLASTQGTRAELGNPQARSPIMAEAELNQLLATATPEQRAALLDAAARFRQLMFERVTEARDVGIINKLTYDNTIVPNKDNYASFRPLDKIEEFVTPMVRRAKGSLSDIENPFITTLLKLQSLNNLIELQRVKNSVRDKFAAMFPGEFKPAETRWTGRRQEAIPPKPGVGRVEILENGKRVAYDTDPYVAKMFEQLAPTDSFWLNKVLEVPFRMGVYPLIIKYNPGFLFAFNPRRDMARTIRNLYATEGVTRRELLPNYASPEVLRAVNDYLQGRPNPMAEAMIRNKAITPSWQGFAHLEREDVMADLLRRYRLADEPTKSAAVRTLMWLPNKINEAGSFLEALPKFASYKTLIERGIAPERAAYLVRNYAGTPNFKVKGEWASVQNSYVPFINIFTQGWKADLKLATSPNTASGWWMQWALQHGWQATLAGLAVAGVFGQDIKKLFAGVSEYDRTNYGVLPLGTQLGAGEFGRKTVYLRFPRDETSRFFSALTYKATRAAADQVMGNAPHAQGLPTEVFAFGAGVLPSPTPVLNVAGAWKDYLAGRNPVDPFRNQPVIGQREFKAGGLPAAGDMLTWTLNQSGALNLIRWNPRAETATELAVSGTPVVNRLVKISDQGYREQQRASEALDASAKARLRVQYNDAVQSLTAQHAWLQSLGEEKRTPEQNRLYYRLHGWVTNLYTPMDEAAWNLRGQKAQQAEVIRRLNAEAERFQRAK